MNKLRNVCFTINNWTEDDYQKAINIDCKYIVIGKEIGTENGTPHLQGYVEFHNSISFKSLQKKLPRARLARRCGTAEQAANYCKKEATYYERGEISKQGERNDIQRCVDIIKNGGVMKDIAQEEPVSFVKYHKGFKALISELIEPRTTAPTVTVLWGKTGCGKSHRARDLASGDYWVWAPQREKWFDGYCGQKNVIFEEFRGQLTYGMMLSLLDKYECPVQYKGGTIEFVATNIIITSPKHPKNWYHDCSDDKIDQLLRRITSIIEVTRDVDILD